MNTKTITSKLDKISVPPKKINIKKLLIKIDTFIDIAQELNLDANTESMLDELEQLREQSLDIQIDEVRDAMYEVINAADNQSWLTDEEKDNINELDKIYYNI